MKAIGITGGVGMGKSTAEELLRARGVPVLDTDQLARDLVEPGQAALAEIAARFGPALLDPAGRLRRDELARIVFADDRARTDLEAILHPRIRECWRSQLEHWRGERRAVGVVIIPLLYETAAEGEFDAVVCVACTATSQRERLRGRGWDDQQIQQRIAAQMPVENKLALADFVVWTEGDLASHAAQWDRILA